MVWHAYDRARLALTRQDHPSAREHLQAAGEDGRALLLLGQLAGAGQGEPADPGRARSLYERAAGLGIAEAAYNLGALHASGRGGAADHPAALRWYERAAELGDVGARRMIGLMHATGQGTPVDDVEGGAALAAGCRGR